MQTLLFLLSWVMESPWFHYTDAAAFVNLAARFRGTCEAMGEGWPHDLNTCKAFDKKCVNNVYDELNIQCMAMQKSTFSTWLSTGVGGKWACFAGFWGLFHMQSHYA